MRLADRMWREADIRRSLIETYRAAAEHHTTISSHYTTKHLQVTGFFNNLLKVLINYHEPFDLQSLNVICHIFLLGLRLFEILFNLKRKEKAFVIIVLLARSIRKSGLEDNCFSRDSKLTV